jgi:uncharacterized metal-binding protein YceD (DUF177 family)
MAAKDPVSADMVEECARCARETPHSVSIEILTENASSENAAFSREPYRVSTCQVCGEEMSVRMNNA